MIKAIETVYKGYRFRSRLEARWAVFMDSLRISWQYEPEGFVLADGTHYLPDFKLTLPSGLTTWYEVKPQGTPPDRKFIAFCESMNSDQSAKDWMKSDGVQVSGDPMELLYGKVMCPRCASFLPRSDAHGAEDEWDIKDVYLDCYRCDMTTPCGSGNPWEKTLAGYGTPHKGTWLTMADDWGKWDSRVDKAARVARQARFEHGACGALA